MDSILNSRRVKPPAQPPTTNLPQLNLRRCADVKPEHITWLWPNRIPRGKITLWCGDPGTGKSIGTMDVAARVSTGASWPDGTHGSVPGSVIVFSAEDGVEDTVVPRLMRAGADLTKVHVMESITHIDPTTGQTVHRAFVLGEHVPLLEQAVERIGDVALVVIDPVSSYGGKVDSHKNGDVRSMLAPLTKLAADHDIAILMVTHLSKGAGGKALYRATGSLAYVAAARAVWMVARDLDDPKRRLLLPAKCNIAVEVTALAFSIMGDASGPFVAWEGVVDMTADSYLKSEATRQADIAKGDDDSVLAEAVAFVQEQLKDGPVLAAELQATAKAQSIKFRTLERARKQLRTKARKRDGTNKWEVCLPDQMDVKSAKPPVTRNLGDVGEVGGVDGHTAAPSKRKSAKSAAVRLGEHVDAYFAKRTDIKPAARFPIHVVCDWLGNTEAIAQERYLQTTDADFEAARNPQEKATRNPARGLSETPCMAAHEATEHQKTPYFQGVSQHSMAEAGFEPARGLPPFGF